jgi:hypothetical protein
VGMDFFGQHPKSTEKKKKTDKSDCINYCRAKELINIVKKITSEMGKIFSNYTSKKRACENMLNITNYQENVKENLSDGSPHPRKNV